MRSTIGTRKMDATAEFDNNAACYLITGRRTQAGKTGMLSLRVTINSLNDDQVRVDYASALAQ